MNRIASGALTLAAMSLLLVLVVAEGGADSAGATPAEIVSVDGTCSFLDANGTLWKDTASQGQIVYTNNDQGNINVTCGGTLPAGASLPTKALRYDHTTGFVCANQPDATWQMVITPSGKAHFTCHLNP